MWNISGGVAFLAEECGAAAVTAFDAMEETDEFRREHQRRSSSVRFVRGDLHRRDDVAAVGRHDVVWCTGLMYHTPSPYLALEHLTAMTGDYLILGNKTIPEVPGVPQAVIFYPGLAPEERDAYAALFGDAIQAPFNYPAYYGNWWWGIPPAVMTAMIRTKGNFEVIEEVQLPRSNRFDDHLIVARRAKG